MNLWAKSLGRLAVLAVALFFFSCEDETSLIGYKNPSKKFNVTYVEIPLTSSVLSIDSIVTDNKERASGSVPYYQTLVGSYFDNRFGEVRAESYLQLMTGVATPLVSNSVYDSVTVQFQLNFYGYGFTGEKEQKFKIHEITGDSLSRLSETFYYSSSAMPYNPTALGEASVTVIYDSLAKQYSLTSGQDTLLMNTRLSDDFGRRLFDFAATTDVQTNTEVQKFISTLKGFALIPSASNGIVGLGILSAFSGVTLHFHTETNGAVVDTLSRNYGFYYPSFTRITTDRSASELAPLIQPYQSFQPGSNLRYVQNGSPVLTKLDLTNFYQFADTLDNVVINSAELILDGVESQDGIPQHSALTLKLLRPDDQFVNYRVKADSTFAIPYYSFTDGRHYYVLSEESASGSASPVALAYKEGTFSGYITLFVQSLFRNKLRNSTINPNRLMHLALYPYSPNIASSVHRTVFNGNSVKLRIYYTKPTSNAGL